MSALPKIKIGIVGATGYTGVELLRLLANHPNAEVTAITSRGEAGIRGRCEIRCGDNGGRRGQPLST